MRLFSHDFFMTPFVRDVQLSDCLASERETGESKHKSMDGSGRKHICQVFLFFSIIENYPLFITAVTTNLKVGFAFLSCDFCNVIKISF